MARRYVPGAGILPGPDTAQRERNAGHAQWRRELDELCRQGTEIILKGDVAAYARQAERIAAHKASEPSHWC